MIMAKTVKYTFGLQTYNIPFITHSISQKEYRVLIKEYDKHVSTESSDDLGEGYVGKKITEKDNGTYTLKIVEYYDGATYISLCERRCKEGYRFKT